MVNLAESPVALLALLFVLVPLPVGALDVELLPVEQPAANTANAVIPANRLVFFMSFIPKFPHL
ncbi:hypothetical protein D3C81_2000650 [compost metagenome]